MALYIIFVFALAGIMYTCRRAYLQYKLYKNLIKLAGRNTKCMKCGCESTRITTLENTTEVLCNGCGHKWEFITFSSPDLIKGRFILEVIKLFGLLGVTVVIFLLF